MAETGTDIKRNEQHKGTSYNVINSSDLHCPALTVSSPRHFLLYNFTQDNEMEISFGISAPNNTIATDYVEIYGRFFA